MMERMTEKHYNGDGYYMKCSEHCHKEDIDCIGCAALGNLVDRLGAYEDTGLTPEEVRGFDERVELVMKINMRLMDKFGDALRTEYGETVADIMSMIDTLYREQCEVMPLPWNEYCLGRKEDTHDDEL